MVECVDFFKGKKVTLMGLGLLGRGVGDARFIASCGASVLVTDMKSEIQLAISVEKLSHELGMSRVQLFRKISALTNKNVTDYIAEFKLQKAKILLKDPEKNISEIAYETGFNNPSYFTTFFKQKTNQTPSEWRNG